MSDYLQNPYLPERRIQEALIGDAPQVLIRWIESHGIKLIRLAHNPRIASSVAGHADLQVFHAGYGTFVYDSAQEHLFGDLADADLHQTTVGTRYPHDCKLNFAVAGDRVFGNQACMDPSLEKICELRHWKRIHVNQGYAKCSVCLVSFDCFITDDPSIHEAGIIERIDTLLIRKGDVLLNGYDYGFIGGASAKVSANELLFFGDITRHRDFDRIKSFLSKHGCSFAYLPDFPLTDIGGIVPVK